MCLFFFLARSFLMIMNGGQYGKTMPADSVFRENEKREVLVQGQVYKKSDTSNIQMLYLKNNSIYSQKKSFYESKIIVYDETFQKVKIGQTLVLIGRTEQFEEAHNAGNFDQRSYYEKEGIFGFVWSEKIVKVSKEHYPLRQTLSCLKEKWKKMFVEILGEKNGNLMSAMLLSEKGEMDAQVKELYQKNGIGHLLAISGLHISFIGLGIYQMMRKTGCPYVLAGIGSGIFLCAYVLMIGASVSVIRAMVMLLFRIGADMSGRVYDMPTALCAAGAVTVLWRPLCVTDAGFLMSYGAICGIFFILPVLKNVFPCKSMFWEGAYASVSINLMLFPVLLYFYFEFPTYSVFLNMLVIPLMSLVLGAGMAGSLCILFCRPLGILFLKICGGILDFFEVAGRMSSRLPYAGIVFGKPSTWQIALYYMLLALGMFFLSKYTKEEREQNIQRKKLRAACIAVGSSMIVLFLAGNGKCSVSEKKQGVFVTILDVGQGDAVFLRGAKGGAYLIDGGSSDVKQVGKYRIEPFLKSQGIGKLDCVFVSHGDADHINGVEEMIERTTYGVKIGCLVLPALYEKDEALYRLALSAKKNGVNVAVLEAGRAITEGEMTVTCIQPDSSETDLEGNSASMVLEIHFGAFTMLCTGDVEGQGEESLIQKVKGKPYDVLKTAHHGSKNSTSRQFVEAVRPKAAVISAGEGNRYGHPHEETIERLKECGCKIYSTIESGAVTIKSDGTNLWIDGFH